MTEISSSVFDLAWEAAQASNKAYDRMTAESIGSHPEDIEHIEWDGYTDSVIPVATAELRLTNYLEALRDFTVLSEMAGVVMSTTLWPIAQSIT